MNISASSVMGDNVRNLQGEGLGEIKDVMLDVDTGKISYAVLDFGGFLGIGNKLFAVPWGALQVDTKDKELVLDVNKEKLENAEGFDQDHWPNFADRDFETRIHDTYGTKPYWQ